MDRFGFETLDKDPPPNALKINHMSDGDNVQLAFFFWSQVYTSVKNEFHIDERKNFA